MPHFAKPFYRKSRGLWYVQIEGKQHNLGPDRKKAFDRYHDLMRETPQPKQVVANDSLAAIVDNFLDWNNKHRSPATYEWYRSRLQTFMERNPKLKAATLRPYHVQQWVDSYADLSGGSKRNLIRSVQLAMRWAEQQGYIDRSPIAHMEKPAGGRRNLVVSPAEFGAFWSVFRVAKHATC